MPDLGRRSGLGLDRQRGGVEMRRGRWHLDRHQHSGFGAGVDLRVRAGLEPGERGQDDERKGEQDGKTASRESVHRLPLPSRRPLAGYVTGDRNGHAKFAWPFLWGRP